MLVAIAVATLASAGAVWFARGPDARALFEQGQAAGRRDPAAGERLLRRARQAAGGRYPDAEVSLCHMLAQRNDWDEALSLFATVDTQACRSDLLLAFGRDALQAQQRSAGLQALEVVAQRGFPECVAALELLRAEYHDSGQQDEEIAAARELTRLEPENPDHWRSLLEMLAGQNKMVDCEAAIRVALEQELPDVYRRNFEHMLIQLLIGRGEIAEARRKVAELKKAEGQSFRLSVSEIELYRLEGRWDLALKTATALSPEAKDLAIMYHVRGAVYFDLEQYENAARNFELALARAPFDERVHFEMSEACRLLRRGEMAVHHGKIAADIAAKRKRINNLLTKRAGHPQDPTIAEQLAELHAELGDESAAQHWRDRAGQLAPQTRAKRYASDPAENNPP
jgi:tetratricopeptide (TPR) repeat protein